jgi:hypothetical protein
VSNNSNGVRGRAGELWFAGFFSRGPVKNSTPEIGLGGGGQPGQDRFLPTVNNW